jgi:hypothetical protein
MKAYESVSYESGDRLSCHLNIADFVDRTIKE